VKAIKLLVTPVTKRWFARYVVYLCLVQPLVLAVAFIPTEEGVYSTKQIALEAGFSLETYERIAMAQDLDDKYREYFMEMSFVCGRFREGDDRTLTNCITSDEWHDAKARLSARGVEAIEYRATNAAARGRLSEWMFQVGSTAAVFPIVLILVYQITRFFFLFIKWSFRTAFQKST